MERADRILPSGPIESLEDYSAGGGGRGLQEARATTPDDVLQRLDGAGLRGRGGAGFPLSHKWRAVMANEAFEANASVVVNAAEGEPGSFKDRAILRANPYHVLEGALIGAHVVDASEVIVGCKRTEARSIDRLEHAIGEMGDAGWFGDVDVGVFAGPSEYLYGEETALLETIDGRYPFPRIAPPYRRGVEEVVKDQSEVAAGVARFLAVESCGQCAACKRDGLAIAETLAKLCASRAEPIDLEQMRVSLGTVADGARCNLPYQQQAVVGSILELFPDQ